MIRNRRLFSRFRLILRLKGTLVNLISHPLGMNPVTVTSPIFISVNTVSQGLRRRLRGYLSRPTRNGITPMTVFSNGSLRRVTRIVRVPSRINNNSRIFTVSRPFFMIKTILCRTTVSNIRNTFINTLAGRTIRLIRGIMTHNTLGQPVL